VPTLIGHCTLWFQDSSLTTIKAFILVGTFSRRKARMECRSTTNINALMMVSEAPSAAANGAHHFRGG
jgi:hypothetical protein